MTLAASAIARAAGTVEIPVQVAGAMSVGVSSLKDARFSGTLKQQFDFSCGSAALATLLTYHYDTPIDERAAFDAMFAHGDTAKIRMEGFSLLDMKSYLAQLGFEADGFEAPLQSLAAAGIPAIVLINENGYNHFVVVKGLRDDRVLVGDPAAGTRVMAIEAFEKTWSQKILFVVRNRSESARFNRGQDWAAVPSAPFWGRAAFEGSRPSGLN